MLRPVAQNVPVSEAVPTASQHFPLLVMLRRQSLRHFPCQWTSQKTVPVSLSEFFSDSKAASTVSQKCPQAGNLRPVSEKFSQSGNLGPQSLRSFRCQWICAHGPSEVPLSMTPVGAVPKFDWQWLFVSPLACAFFSPSPDSHRSMVWWPWLYASRYSNFSENFYCL